jgi:cytochrome c
MHRMFAPAMAVAMLLACGVVRAQANPAPADTALLAKGKRLYMMCAACHDATASGPARVGPHLSGILGRQAGAVAGYKYSPAMAAKPFVWDEAKLDAWLVKPTAVVPGTTMAYMGMANADDRKALVAFLTSLK